jgi:hypothetical protein
MGFGKENRIVVTLHGADVIEKLPAIRTKLLKDSRIRCNLGHLHHDPHGSDYPGEPGNVGQ